MPNKIFFLVTHSYLGACNMLVLHRGVCSNYLHKSKLVSKKLSHHASYYSHEGVSQNTKTEDVSEVLGIKATLKNNSLSSQDF